MLHIYLDTNVFFVDPKRHKAAFKTVMRLVEAKKLSIHLSVVNRREFVSQQENIFDEELAKIQKSLKTIRAMKAFESDRKFKAEVLAMIKGRRSSISEEFDRWLNHYGVEVHPVSDGHGRRILDMYFNGTKPFRGPKNKNDFPDAFMCLSIAEVASDLESLHVVSSDDGVRGSCEEVENVLTYRFLEDLTGSELIKELITTTESLERLLDYLRTPHPLLEKHVGRVIGEALKEELCTQAFKEQLPSVIRELSTPSISGTQEAYDISLQTDEVKDYGNGLITIPFSATWDVIVRFIHSGVCSPAIDDLLIDAKTEGLSSASLGSLSGTTGSLPYRARGIIQCQVDPQVLKTGALKPEYLGIIPGSDTTSSTIILIVDEVLSMRLVRSKDLR